MPTVKEVTRYPYKGVEYQSLKALRSRVEDDLGELVDRFTHKEVLHPGKALALHQFLVNNREELVGLLTVGVETEGEDYEPRNIFDLV